MSSPTVVVSSDEHATRALLSVLLEPGEAHVAGYLAQRRAAAVERGT